MAEGIFLVGRMNDKTVWKFIGKVVHQGYERQNQIGIRKKSRSSGV